MQPLLTGFLGVCKMDTAQSEPDFVYFFWIDGGGGSSKHLQAEGMQRVDVNGVGKQLLQVLFHLCTRFLVELEQQNGGFCLPFDDVLDHVDQRLALA